MPTHMARSTAPVSRDNSSGKQRSMRKAAQSTESVPHDPAVLRANKKTNMNKLQHSQDDNSSGLPFGKTMARAKRKCVGFYPILRSSAGNSKQHAVEACVEAARGRLLLSALGDDPSNGPTVADSGTRATAPATRSRRRGKTASAQGVALDQAEAGEGDLGVCGVRPVKMLQEGAGLEDPRCAVKRDA